MSKPLPYNDKPWMEFKKLHSKNLDDFPIAFAFDSRQMEDLFKKLNVTSVKELYKVSNGGYIRKTDSDAWGEFVTNWYKSLEDFQKNDDDLLGALVYELGNHEYDITYDTRDTIESVGLDADKLVEREVQLVQKAVKIFWEMRNR